MLKGQAKGMRLQELKGQAKGMRLKELKGQDYKS